ncbi:hypothetical protein [Siccirubricoccus phaeus]|uniref:hypothetical protein n=1 Tax=Siccirubricoccus phaeus TaxID=2595053 RepID=UPI001F43E96F|nr:hypothetical protein [Siccirubricoccus phaeus]
MVTRTEAAAIDEYRFANRIPTRAEAIRRLLAIGLAAEGKPLPQRDGQPGQE